MICETLSIYLSGHFQLLPFAKQRYQNHMFENLQAQLWLTGITFMTQQALCCHT